MFIAMSIKPTLTDELLKVNSTLQIIFSVIEGVVEENEVRNEEDSTSKQAYIK